MPTLTLIPKTAKMAVPGINYDLCIINYALCIMHYALG